jgi:SAM-dependent methyltransferase
VALVLDFLEYRLLKTLWPNAPDRCSGKAYEGKSKVLVLLGPELVADTIGQTVIDFGCGEGSEAVELAKFGAKHIIGVDIRDDVLAIARQRARAAGVADVCEFVRSTDTVADIIVSIDSFEHFEDPAEILRTMDRLLKPDGEILASFGPTWYHPLGGHLFSVFPWAHLIVSEDALIRWRSDFKTDGATHFCEVAGGLNQLTIAKFEQILKRSPFRASMFQMVPIRRLKWMHNRWTREFTTGTVRCRLKRRLRCSTESRRVEAPAEALAAS